MKCFANWNTFMSFNNIFFTYSSFIRNFGIICKVLDNETNNFYALKIFVFKIHIKTYQKPEVY